MKEDALDANRALWDAWTTLHEGSDFYDLDAFRAGRSSLNPIELRELGPVEGRSLLHLQCHIGIDTLSWARLGARAVGSDLSPKAVALANRLAEELALDARFVCADLYDLPEVLDERFDVVFTSYGALEWLRDLDRWGEIVAGFLAPGGVFYIVEFHPVALTLSDDGRPFHHPYFSTPEPIRTLERGSYADPDADFEGTSYAWSHSLGEIVSAVAGAGLRIEFLHEFAESPYDCYPFTREIAPGRAVVPGYEDKLPLLFSLRARKHN